MIKYVLKCRSGHEFESWFAGAASFEDQLARGRVTCPMCHTDEVGKAIAFCPSRRCRKISTRR